MMRYLLASVILLPQLLLAQPNEISQINWAINTAPPFHIVSGDYKQQGLCDVLIDAVHRYVPELKKHREILPQPRIGRALERAENLCFACMIHKKQSEQGAYYSVPTHVYLPHQIIANNAAAQRIREKYPLPVPLAELLADEEFHFGYPAGRRFGVLQPLIEGQDSRPGNRLVRSGDNGPEAILQMIEAQRLDYTIDYSIIRRYHELNTGQLLQLLPIAENHQQLVHGAIGCSDSSWGRSVIEKINQAMPQIRADAEFNQSQDLWFEHHPQYRQLNKRALATIKPR
ncbi:hypothetical protein MN202_18040 [Rheinheimera muenzenbergensis]|uniref:ABC-type amino acid transport substrate-binding protein n=1 Tax=Rheinheimera muenzenbergensis TaxID=1193628 RepID=A0ABU8CBB1_9GAMM